FKYKPDPYLKSIQPPSPSFFKAPTDLSPYFLSLDRKPTPLFAVVAFHVITTGSPWRLGATCPLTTCACARSNFRLLRRNMPHVAYQHMVEQEQEQNVFELLLLLLLLQLYTPFFFEFLSFSIQLCLSAQLISSDDSFFFCKFINNLRFDCLKLFSNTVIMLLKETNFSCVLKSHSPCRKAAVIFKLCGYFINWRWSEIVSFYNQASIFNSLSCTAAVIFKLCGYFVDWWWSEIVSFHNQASSSGVLSCIFAVIFKLCGYFVDWWWSKIVAFRNQPSISNSLSCKAAVIFKLCGNFVMVVQSWRLMFYIIPVANEASRLPAVLCNDFAEFLLRFGCFKVSLQTLTETLRLESLQTLAETLRLESLQTLAETLLLESLQTLTETFPCKRWLRPCDLSPCKRWLRPCDSSPCKRWLRLCDSSLCKHWLRHCDSSLCKHWLRPCDSSLC
ncbi:hypothetical protein MAR_018565, partial [Mya arenaria]